MIAQLEKIERLGLLVDDEISTDPENPALKNGYIVTILNNSIKEFQNVVRQNGSDDSFRKVISSTIEKIEENEIGLDTEDKEAVCRYFEKIMDAVGLESSGGILNTWLYGFDPNTETYTLK